jgi:hypothetical protein
MEALVYALALHRIRDAPPVPASRGQGQHVCILIVEN